MASAESSASAHPSIHYVEKIAMKAEAELERLRQARPALASRIDKAEAIVCRQLGSLNGYRPIRVVVHPDDAHSYRVLSDGKLGRSYTVNPHDWSCDCPDHRRREAACKHALACWVLERAYRTPEPKTVEPESPTGDSESLRDAVPLSVVMAGLDRMSA
ncbi:MAG: hypothetical protein M3N18_00665 [Actinomycetota bacterium]|nr:hypothetical protein [Actinomycetota bacterium]